MSLRNLANATNQNNNDESQLDDNIVKQFKLILTIVFIVLILFLLYFVYNLIKCYLPKWRRQQKYQEDELKKAQIIEPKKEGPVTELY
jgi:preprotein translocase subunit SecG